MVETCHACHHPALHEFPAFRELARSTSDCRPWPPGGRLALCSACGLVQKVQEPEFAAMCATIYEDYQLYFQGNGSEQRIMDQSSGQSSPRSKLVLKIVEKIVVPATAGRLLDVGCGAGHFLRTFGCRYPGWELHGLEVNPAYAGEVLAIPGVTRFHCCPVEEMNERYDIIALNHALEHIPEPLVLLTGLRRLLAPEGLLLLDVPYFPDNPFDLIIADHCSHFAIRSLTTLLHRSGFSPRLISSTCIRKELLVVAEAARVLELKSLSSKAWEQRRLCVQGIVDWLSHCAEALRSAENLAFDGNGGFGIFGTAIAGVWAANTRKGSVNFFLDEDPARSGKTFMGASVLMPAKAPARATVFAAFPADIARRLAARHAGLPVRFLLPPPLKLSARACDKDV